MQELSFWAAAGSVVPVRPIFEWIPLINGRAMPPIGPNAELPNVCFSNRPVGVKRFQTIH